MDEKHRLAIDRSKQAVLVVQSIEQYNALPHDRADLEGYDTKYSDEEAKRLIQKEKYSKEQKRIIKEAQSINKQRNINDLQKDLRTTKNVVSFNREGLNKWKENPNKYDFTNIDTRPKGMTGYIVNEIRKENTNISRPKKINTGITTLGLYYPSQNMIKLNKNWIHKDKDYHNAYAHELGHGIDKNIHGFNLQFDKTERKSLKKGAFRINPLNKNSSSSFKKYRMDKKELVADYFSDFVNNPRRAKKENPILVNKLIPENIQKNIKKRETIFINKFLKKLKI